MRVYTKSSMPSLGVQAAGVREVCRLLEAASLDELRELWDGAAHREER